ncbi:tRNA uracil 4-sulfurtransferase ThiI [Thalassobacillus sp. C254]|uniref:tRNA uracil 4-sulfurtransferase ThiI n=1 Tax=Thalassobacillus sp. C254 TaxID=1225341 RepID=UPI0006D28832|nr:tRNA uracil 4-sulfurtransferase ThiI [Thalassobacillus sp. C254]
MIYDHILVRYGELALKGKNRTAFEKQLQRNIKYALTAHPTSKIKRTFGRMLIEIHDEDPKEMLEKLKHVFGISSFSLAIKTENEEEKIKRGGLQAFLNHSPKAATFKVSARRTYKPFPIPSQQLNPVVGAHILRNTEGVTVDVHNPDVEITVEVREQGTYISCGRIEGAGGLPVGTSGKVMLMLSGGIDSPVAGYMALKRGVDLEAVHFHSPPYTNERARKKVEDLTQILTKFGGKIKLHIVPFTDTQKAIHQHIPSSYAMTVMRRMMLRITAHIAENRGAKAIVNGESLGQVASQTLDSMYSINEVTNLPILRPLVTMDKQEVIQIAHQIDTYETSILPYEDCCTIFLPSDSKTKPNREKSNRFENRLDFQPFIEEAVQKVETVELGPASGKKENVIDDLL